MTVLVVRKKRCPMCKETLPWSSFSMDSTRGKPRPQTYCRKCSSERLKDVPCTSSDDKCAVNSCARKRRRQEWCFLHYTRWKRHQDPEKMLYASPEKGKSAAFKKQWLIEYKLTKGCADCGFKAHPAALDFDHLPGFEKRQQIRSGQSFGWVALQEEVAKCEVVCANCHRIRTADRREQ